MLDELKQECIERMKILKLDEHIIEKFIKENTIYLSDIGGKLEKVNTNELKYIKQYENSKNVKIYHVIKQKTESKDISIFLYVNSNSKNWENEKRDIKLGYDCAIVYTKEEQIREIGIVNKKGKIARIVI